MSRFFNTHARTTGTTHAMLLSACDLSVAVFVRGLTNLKSMLMKGEAHASASGMDPAELTDAQLAPGMYGLAVQVHWAAEGARLAVQTA